MADILSKYEDFVRSMETTFANPKGTVQVIEASKREPISYQFYFKIRVKFYFLFIFKKKRNFHIE